MVTYQSTSISYVGCVKCFHCRLSCLCWRQMFVAEQSGNALRLRVFVFLAVERYEFPNTQTSIVIDSYGKVFEVFNKYGRSSGSRLTTSKSRGLWFGRWRTRTYSPYGLTWVSTSLKIVGLHFGNENASIITWDGVCAKIRLRS